MGRSPFDLTDAAAPGPARGSVDLLLWLGNLFFIVKQVRTHTRGIQALSVFSIVLVLSVLIKAKYVLVGLVSVDWTTAFPIFSGP